MRSIVVDTGPLVAWFDPDDKHHHRAERWLKLHGAGFKRYTTLAVLTEALHLIDSAGAGAALLEWIAAGGLVIVAVENADLRAISARMLRYRDTPMAGRTHLQQALPVTFGYKIAIYANYAILAAIPAVKRVLAELMAHGSAARR